MEDDVVGFHAQQAVEKALKVALVLAGIPFPRTHDLDFLLARAEGHGLEVPVEIEESEWLSPWAAQLRYDEIATGLDREKAREAPDAAVAWARTLSHERSQHSSCRRAAAFRPRGPKLGGEEFRREPFAQARCVARS